MPQAVLDKYLEQLGQDDASVKHLSGASDESIKKIGKSDDLKLIKYDLDLINFFF